MGKSAFITGGGRGIGRAIALQLAQTGHRVAIADIREDSAKETLDIARENGGNGLALHVDVSDAPSVEEACLKAVEALEGIDVLVNCAGWDTLRPFLETDEDLWDRIIDINFKGVLRTTRHILPGMLEKGWGRIVNIGSDAARVGSSYEAVYAGAKGGVIAFTKTIARETARRGVTANTVCPGPTNTPLLHEATGKGSDAQRILERMTQTVPMKRLAEPEEIAFAVAFLAADEARFITGQTLSVSGGLTMV